MRRALWKGAISFGLINIPVELFTAQTHDELDFTMLDKRDLSPVGYRRISKKTGKEVAWDNIVKGYEYEDGKYVLLSEEDLRRANVEATQTIDIESFVDATQIPITYYQQPYYLAPLKSGTKAYALLREMVAAYSPRARPGAPVSTPLSWKELSPGIHADTFTIANLPQRLASLKRDPWQDYAKTRQRLSKKMLQLFSST